MKNKYLIAIGTLLVVLLVGYYSLRSKPIKNWYRSSNWKRKTWKMNIRALHNSTMS